MKKSTRWQEKHRGIQAAVVKILLDFQGPNKR